MNKPHSRQLRTSCYLIVTALLAIQMQLPAIAQSDELVEEVIVTGSRIARDPNLTAPVAIQSVSADDILLSGELDIAEVINDIPALLTSATAEGSVDSVFANSVGESVLQLRGMGNERTLVLVDGRRHVSGVTGSQAVDINSIPSALVQRVEVLTGGASAVYGADAVTGVVNFILKDDFDGAELNLQSGVTSEGDGERYNVSGIFGHNFANGRGNVTAALDYSRSEAIFFGDRDFSRNNGEGDDLPNPALRFQRGDISAANTPNFAQFYNLNNGFFPIGFRIPSVDAFLADFMNSFGTTPTLTPAELALIERASNAPTRVILRQPTFSISSNRGVIAPIDFLDRGTDLDNDGVSDCRQSFVGFNGLLGDANDPSAAFNNFGLAGGCWVVDAGGNVRPYADGLVTSNFNQFGGDGIQNNFDANHLTPQDEKITLNLTGKFDLTDSVSVFGEFKFSDQTTDFGGPLNTFYDLLTVLPDNPYIPAALQQVADDAGGLFVTRDPTDLGSNIGTNERQVFRIVGGIEGTMNNGWQYEVSANYGEFERDAINRNAVIQDRWFAAIDVTTDANGNPICRSDIDATPPASTLFGIPLWDPGFFTFLPGDGQCRPANILGGPGAISQEAVDFITQTVVDNFKLEQTVFSATVFGDTAFGIGDYGMGFAFGAEYRDEKSTSTFNPLGRGVLPINGPNGTAGTLLRNIDGFSQNSLIFDPETLNSNSSGSYDVWELFGELSIPLVRDAAWAQDLTVDIAARYSDYSTVGDTLTWKAGASWAPINDLRFRGVFSKAIRAPNIFELFDPDQGATFRPVDPCDQAEIDVLVANGDPRGPIRQANCIADGIAMGFADPLSARFSGVTSGNPTLKEEEADTITFGFVVQPSGLDGLTVSVDYWDIEIEAAISAVSAQDIVDNCYDSATLNNDFCGLFTRNRDSTSAQFLGFNFLRQSQLNFGAIESEGIDVAAQYVFDVGVNEFTVGLSGTWVDRLDFFFDPSDATAIDPELGEIQRPEWAGNATLRWARDKLAVTLQTQFMDKQALRSVEIETQPFIYGPAGIADNTYIHDISFRYLWDEQLQFYGGIQNISDKEPFITEQAYPVGPRGRSFFAGLRYGFY